MISMDMRRSLSTRWGRWRLEHRSLGAVVCRLIRRTPLWILPKITKERIRFVDCSRVLHDIETGDQFHIARRAAPGGHADALGLVGARILRPVFREQILCITFIAHARLRVAPKTNRASGRRVATWADVQRGRAVG